MSHAALLEQYGADEQVTVNQRALVEKILARYSGEHTLYRELLQNADDASASTVELHFRTTKVSESLKEAPTYAPGSLPDLATTNIAQIVVRNDGIVFRDEDWNRLKKIAEGNPDEQKIGAFGVGFYSLFSICDEPVVSSGPKVMQFYWKGGGDQLYVKSAVNPNGERDATPDGKPWSTFYMTQRELAPMPSPHDFARFLTTCIGFTQKIQRIAMYFDGIQLCEISKTAAPSRPVAVRSSIATMSPLRILRMSGIEETPMQMRVHVSNWMNRYAPKPNKKEEPSSGPSMSSSFASKMLAAFTGRSSKNAPEPEPTAVIAPPENPFDKVSATLFLRIVSSHLKVTPSTHFASEMLRATKKNLPSQTTYSLIWTSKEEFDASQRPDSSDKSNVKGAATARSLFAGLMSDIAINGRVFIGFPTFQTTGCAASVAARFVSTVERESLDFQARYVADWNKELLWAGGVLARTIYEEEMDVIGKDFRALPAAGDVKDRRQALEERASHLLRFFSFTQSTPSPVVGIESEKAFFSCCRDTVTLLSTTGTMEARRVRVPNPAVETFIKSVPVLPKLVFQQDPRMLHALREQGVLKDISLQDVLDDLSNHPLQPGEAVACFRWWLSMTRDPSYIPSLFTRFQDVAIISIPANGSDAERVAPLKSFKTFLNAKLISPDMPLPRQTLPFEISRSLPPQDLVKIFGLQELGLPDWVKFLTSSEMMGNDAKVETNIKLSPPFTEQVLNTLSRGWNALSSASQEQIANMLRDVDFLPTRFGVHKPSETYFANVDLFADLPILNLPSGNAPKGFLEQLLVALGVRKHVDLQIVFTRLLGQGDWSHIETLKYFVSVRNTLTANELYRLRKTAWLPKDGEAKVRKEDGSFQTVRYRAEELYEPVEVFHNLGLPLLDWSTTTRWRPNSEEAKFLFSIGLQKTPTVEHLLARAAGADPTARELALSYFLEHWTSNEYGAKFDPTKHKFAFVPATLGNEVVLKHPSEVYVSEQLGKLGLPVLLPKYQPEAHKLKVAREPSGNELAKALMSMPPRSFGDARDIFAYMSSQISKLHPSEIALLQKAPIIPFQADDGKITMRTAAGCFFATTTSLPPGLSALFRTLPNFGPSARPFLSVLGVKDTPSPVEIAELVADDPSRIFSLCPSSEVYLSVLRIIATSFVTFNRTLKSRLQASSFFLGTTRQRTSQSNGGKGQDLMDFADEDDDDESSTLSLQLVRASQLIVNDDPQSFRVFETKILACPQEDVLEDLAESLGAQRISKLVSEHFRPIGEPGLSKRVNELQRAITERAYLFLMERKQQYGSSELRHDADWIQSHLEVLEVRSIEVLKTLKHNGQVSSYRTNSSAFSQDGLKGGVRLFIAGDCELDYFEVAVALCKHLLKKQRPNDALLFMTILSTSLKSLKRRGFNVDRILNARQAEREAADRKLREQQEMAAREPVPVESTRSTHAKGSCAQTDNLVRELAELFPDADRNFLRTLIETQNEPKVQNAANQLLSSDGRYPRAGETSGDREPVDAPVQHGAPGQTQSAVSASRSASTGGYDQRSDSTNRSPFDGFKKRFGINSSSIKSKMPMPSLPSSSGSSGRPAGGPGKGTHQSTPEATRANIARAIQATREGSDPEIKADFNKERVPVAESSYCDTSSGTDLAYVCDVGGLRFYASKSLQMPDRFVSDNVTPLMRFINRLIKPIADVFTLELRTLHVFYDESGPLVAFNRNGSIFLNYRFYREWKHDELVVAGKMTEPLLSTYHTVAHELAHNIAGNGHDSEFAFYLGSICEQYFLRMSAYLSTIQKGAGQRSS